MTEPLSRTSKGGDQPRPSRIISAKLSTGTLVEMVYRPDKSTTAFCVASGDNWAVMDEYTDGNRRIVPYSPENNLLKNNVVLLPSGPEEYVSTEELVREIQAYVHRYVDVSNLYERLACYYVLLSWVYDDFNELPYLRLLGDPGSGKTRFLLIVGSICYKPIFASGASSVSPLFRILDAVRGTLIIDEGDFRLSDEKAEVTKVLNNGNARGFPVLRSEVNPKGEYNPTAFHVFGPKIVATRGYFQDWALESRCLTEHMGQDRLRNDIPINLPASQQVEALRLRNKLLLFRFRNLSKQSVSGTALDRAIEPRLRQVFSPLLAVIHDEKTQQELLELARRYHRDLQNDRGMSTEAQVLEIIRDLRQSADPTLSVKNITSFFEDRHGEEYDRKVTAKWIGWVIRRKLHLKTQKRNGVFVIGDGEERKLQRLMERYAVTPGAESQGKAA